MSKTRTILVVLFLIFPLLKLTGQSYLFDVQKINIENGLPDRSAFYLDEDNEGFIWVSLRGKICRYDGYMFKSYNSSQLNIGDNYSAFIAIDSIGNILYSENDRVRDKNSGIITPSKDSIYSFEDFSKGLLESNKVFKIHKSIQDKNTIYLNTLKGEVYKYDGSFQKIYQFPNQKKYVFSCEKVDDGYWILGQSVLRKINFNQEEVESYSISEPYDLLFDIKSLSPGLVLESRNHFNEKRYWTLKNGTLIPYELPNTKGRVQIFTITEDLIYYSDDNVLYISDKVGRILYTYDEIDLAGANFSYIDAFIDSQNILWITCGNGIYKIVTKKSLFKTYHKNYSIRGIFQDGNELFIGGYGSNIKINLLNGKTQPFFDDNSTAVHFLRDPDHPDSLWVGTILKELCKYNPKTDQYKTYYSKENLSLDFPFINSITKKLWVGSSGGLFYLDKNLKKLEYFSTPDLNENVAVKHTYQNKEGLWIVTDHGLFLMDAKSETIVKYLSKKTGFPSDHLLYLYEDKEGIFWIGTKDIGLIKWDKKKDSFRIFDDTNGLSNNTIYAVYEDNHDFLWLTSNYGLMSFNKNNFNTRVYLPQDGIPHEEFNTFSHFKATDGTLYFGGLNGVISFNPDDLYGKEQDNFPIHITNIKLLSETSDDFIDRTKNFLQTNQIILNPNDVRLEIEVSLLDFTNPETNQYTYQIEGLHKQWLFADQNKIVLPKLPHGDYILNVRGKGASGNWSANILKIPIHVNTPFYLKRLFLTWVSLGFLALVFIYIRLRTRKLKNDRKRLEAEVYKRTQQIEWDKQTIASQAEALTELDKAKNRFFSNITHEFKTPLTLIIGPLEQLIQEEPPPNIFKRRIHGVVKNAKRIQDLINQLLDLSQLESGQMKLKYTQTDMISYSRDITKRFQVLAERKQQKLSFHSELHQWHIALDADKWQKILFNLISNAIKFTPEAKNIDVYLNRIYQGKDEFISLKVKDEGIGIDQENIQKIFDRFYQVDLSNTKEQQGTGIGLSLVYDLIILQGGEIEIDSNPGLGTTFHVKIPVPNSESIDLNSDSHMTLIDLPNIELLTEKNVPLATNESKSLEGESLEVLIVEDSNDMREYIRQCLKHLNYNITEAINGEEGYIKAQSIVPDLIISDIMMPKKDGYSLVQEIRGNISTSHIPLILLTAKSSLDSKLKGLRHGADVYLTKPFSPKELILRMEKLIEIRKLLQKRYTNDSIKTNNAIFEQEDEFIAKLKAYIIENLDDPNLNGDTIGKALALSRVHLYRKLKALTNQSITEYVKTIRLQEAFKLMQEGKLNVSEIAFQTGFTSVSHFSRSFKEAYGKSPTKM